MTINRHAKAFGDKDLTVTITAIDGPSARQTLTLNSRESVKFDPGPKAAAMKGMGVGPITVVAVAADPSVEIKLSVANESRAVMEFLGGVSNRFTVDAVFSSRGMTSQHYQATPCALDGGGGFETTPDAPPTDTLKAKVGDILINGKSVYEAA